MQLEAGKRYKTRDGDIVFIIGLDHEMNDACGYKVRYSFSRPEEKDIKFDTTRILTWNPDGSFISTTEQHAMDIVEEYKEPRSGQVKLWVYESASHGLFYYTTEIDADKPYGELHPSERLLCAQIVDWKENGETS